MHKAGKYKLIDIEGWLANDSCNHILLEFFNGDVVDIDCILYDKGYFDSGEVGVPLLSSLYWIIGESDWKYFEYMAESLPKPPTKVIIFNAPPRSGKDYTVDILVGTGDYNKRQFKTRLIEITAKRFGLSVDEFMEGYDKKILGKWYKDLPQTRLMLKGGTLSQRESLIDTSENFIKPLFGDEYFGKALVDSLEEGEVHLVADGGFVEEINPLIEKLGADNILIIKLSADGCSFKGDSRDYINVADLSEPVQELMYHNKKTEQDIKNIETLIKLWLKK